MPEVTIPEWIPTGLRYVIIGLVAPPAVSKFLTYAQSVDFFTSLGIPSPELMVLLVGVVELTAVVLLLVDYARWAVAVALLPVMLVAFWMTGDWQAMAVLLGAVGLLAIDMGLQNIDETDRTSP